MKRAPLAVDWKQALSPSAIGSPGKDCHFVDDLQPAAVEAKVDELFRLSDQELDEKIARLQKTRREVVRGLPDHGFKLRGLLFMYQQEQGRRREAALSLEKVIEVEEPKKAAQSAANVLREVGNGNASDASQQFPSNSSPVSASSQPWKDKNGTGSGNAFESELKYYSGSKGKEGKQVLKVKSDRNIPLRTLPFLSPISFRRLNDEHRQKKPSMNDTSRYSPLHLERKTFTPSSENCHVESSLCPRRKKVETVDLSDEDEPSPHITEVDKSPEWAEDSKIYYPSRDDPEVVELSRSDLQCLNPELPLSSPIINFYIRFLQRLKESSMDDYYFFNTYFYHKLEEAVSCKGSNKSTVYGRIRRWWKGVNIFQKAYIFLPIHADQHWSLVIICIPAIEDDSGPIILHLDSLGFHPSSKIFENVDRSLCLVEVIGSLLLHLSLLKEEWSCLSQEFPCPDVPISDRIWKHLCRRIDHKVISVPQQQNDYDCGLFVLYFMERFILEAPKRWRRKDVDMFGCKWFLPEEASGRRRKIRRLLHSLFKDAKEESQE